MIERVKEFPSLTIIRHPLVQHKLTILRDQKTETKHFKELVDEIAILMAYESTSELSLEPRDVNTPLEVTTGWHISGKKLSSRHGYSGCTSPRRGAYGGAGG